MNSKTSTKQTKARPNKKTAESAGNISVMKRNQTLHNDVSTISSQVWFRESKLILKNPLGRINEILYCIVSAVHVTRE